MQMANHFRVSDRIDLVAATRDDFVARKRITLVQWLYRIFLWAGVVPLGVALIVYYDALWGAMLCVLVGMVVYVLAQQILRLQRMLHNTEFLNALFSSALNRHHAFCAVAKKDGELVYANQTFQALFPGFMERPERTVTALLENGKVEASRRSPLLESIRQGNEIAVTIPFAIGNESQPRPFVLSVDPIAKPSGFVLLRGKEAA